MNLLCVNLTITKRKKKESSFNFIRLHPKPHLEPLVTPPSTPLAYGPPLSPVPPPLERTLSEASYSATGASKFTEQLELPPSFYEMAFSQSDCALIPKPLNLQAKEGLAKGSGGIVEADKEGDVGAGRREGGDVHPYLRPSVYGVVDSSSRENCHDEGFEGNSMDESLGGVGEVENDKDRKFGRAI
jgi:hypothetical protein